MADSISSADDALMRYNAGNFLDLAKHITQQSEFIKQFDRLTPIVQEHVVLELCDHDNKRLLDLLPYKKYEVGYNKVIKDNIERSPGLIKEILNTYYEDMQELLASLFQGAMSENSCIVVAEVLAKTALGLGVLDMAIQKGDFLHQVCAIKGVNKTIDVKSVQPELLDVIKKYRTHENYLIRLECILGLNKTNNLTIDYLSAALQDENSNIRYRTIHLIKKIDAGVAKDFVILLEDKEGHIVSEILGILEKPRPYQVLDEEALADAMIKELVIRESGRPSEYFNTEIISKAFQALFKWNSRLYGKILKTLCELAFNNKGAIRRRAVLVAINLDERGFLAQINENAESNPEAAKEVLNLVTGNLDTNIIANQISGTDPSDVQQNAANQIKLLAQYHESGLQQAKTSFNWAIALSLAGFPFLILAIYYLLVNRSETATSVISSIASVLVEFIAGTLFYLYNQTRKQLTYYHQQMNQIQRFLLANSVAESLESPAKENARIELIKTIATTDIRDDTTKS